MKYFVTLCLILCMFVSQVWAEADTARMDQNRIATANIAEKTKLMITLMQKNQFNNKTMTKARVMVKEAENEGLPVEHIVNKALEGMAKGVSEDAIVQAMAKIKSRYAYAYKTANQFRYQKRKEIGDGIAECLTAGITEEEMDKIMEHLKERVGEGQADEDRDLVEQSVLAARNMARMGVPSDVTGDVVCKALENLYTAQDMKKMQINFREQARVRAASIVAGEYAEGLSHGVSSQDLGHYGQSMKNGSNGSKMGGNSMSGSGAGSTSGSRAGSSSGSGGNGGNRGGRNR